MCNTSRETVWIGSKGEAKSGVLAGVPQKSGGVLQDGSSNERRVADRIVPKFISCVENIGHHYGFRESSVQNQCRCRATNFAGVRCPPCHVHNPNIRA
eukprot:scaffold1022_cov307-Pavlova_lutheri.AAC.2